MKFRKGMAGVAVAVLAMSSAAWADDSATLNGSSSGTTAIMADDSSSAPAATPAPAPTPDRPLMWLLDQGPVGPALKKWDMSIVGNVEFGYNADTTKPRESEGFDGVLFPGAYKDRGELNQLDLTIARTLDQTKPFDVGFTVQGGYGVDDSLIHSSGILDSDNKIRGLKALGGSAPIDQLDLTQAFVNVGFAVGGGQYVSVILGKFVTIFGDEVINPEGNQFYTHSYQFSYAEPATSTGIFGVYSPNSEWAFQGGITQGYNNSLYDGNHDPDIEGQAAWTPSFDSKKWTFTTNGAFGTQNSHDDSDWEVLAEELVGYQASDQLKVTGDFIYGDDPHTGKFGPGNGPAQWYGAAFYGGYTINSYVTANARAEVYDDVNGFTYLASPNHRCNVYDELTLGVSVTPFPNNNIGQNLVIRPEIREDCGQYGVFGGEDQEFTFAVDAYFKF